MTRAAAEARPTADLLKFIAEGHRLDPIEPVAVYRPYWNRFTGSMTATILLDRIIARWVDAGRHPFYEFSQPCDHPYYITEQSWVEELGVGRREFEYARARIAVRTPAVVDPTAYVSYWVDGYRLTWYAVNEERLLDALQSIGPAPDWLPTTNHCYRPPLRNPAIRLQFNRRRAKHYRALVDRDGERCRHCGATQNLTIDHVVAIINGGGNDLANLQLLCRSCNSRKGAR